VSWVYSRPPDSRISEPEIGEVTVCASARRFHTGVSARDSAAALDAAVDKLEHQVRCTKDRRARH
jgi:ribosome-associated translation inhibitor RaiA